MRWQLIVLAVAASASFGLSQPGAGKRDEDALQGVWRVARGEFGGKAIPPEMIAEMNLTLTIKGNLFEMKYAKMSVKDSGGSKGEPTKSEEVEPGTFKLDSSRKPKHIDITTKKDGKTIVGIYELTGDEFKVCLDPEGKTRPTEFKSKADSPVGIVVYKHVKK